MLLLSFGWYPDFRAQIITAGPDSVVVLNPDTVSAPPFKFIPFREWSRPAKAAFYSAVLPGLGQAYNKKYWKIPILYLGGGTIIYFIGDNHEKYMQFRRAYEMRTDGDEATVDQLGQYSDQILQTGNIVYRRNRDLSVILLALAYGVNILDAHVDAHLSEFDISDDLTLKLKPQLLPMPGTLVAPALTLKLNYKSR